MHPFSSPEPLESRIAPAGIVTATLVAGKLTLTGDVADNVIAVDGTGPDQLTLTGTAGTTIVFGGNAAAGTVVIDAPVLEIATDLGLGKDNLTANSITLDKGFTVTDAGGDTALTLTNLDLTGALALTLGDGADTVSVGGAFTFAKSLTAALGNGSNSFTFTGTGADLGSLAVTGGSGGDTVLIAANDLAVGGALSVQLGDGANVAEFSGASLQVGGALNVTHGTHPTGTSKTLFNGSDFDIKGATLFSFTDGANQLSVTTSRAAIFRGLVNVHGGSGGDSITLGGQDAQYRSGLTVSGGAGTNDVTLNAATATLKTLTYLGGPDADSIGLAGGTFAVQGATTLNFGAGANSLSGRPTSASYAGLVKLTGGADADALTLGGVSLRLGLGATLDGGPGANSLVVNGDTLWSSGAISFLNGDHATGTSSAALTGFQHRIDKAVSAVFGAGQDDFQLAGSNTTIKGNVTVTALGVGGTNVSLTPTVLNILGKLSVTSGSDGLTAALTAQTMKLGALSIIDGAGNATVSIATDGLVRGATLLQLGAGAASVSLNGVQAALALKGGFTESTQSGSADAETLSLNLLKLSGTTKITLGAAAANVTIDNLLAAVFTLDTGAGADQVKLETSNSGIVSVFTGPVAILLGAGADTLTFGANTAAGKVSFKNKVTLAGGPDGDIFTDKGSLYVTPPVTTDIP